MPFGGEDADSYYDEGRTASMKGDLAKAAECFNRAVEIDAHHWAAYHQLAKCDLRQGKVDKALDLLTRVVFKQPGRMPARLDLGQALMTAGKLDEAKQQFQEVLNVEPNNSRAYLGLAQVAFQQGDWQGTTILAQGALQHSGPNIPTLFLLGKAAHLIGNDTLAGESLVEADKLVEKSLELNPDAPENHYLRGEIRFAEEKYSSALESYRAAADRAHHGERYSAYSDVFGLNDILAKQGLCYQRLGKLDDARRVGHEIIKRDPKHKLGMALAALEGGD